MLSFYLIGGFVLVLAGLGIWIYHIATHSARQAAKAEQASALLVSQTDSVKVANEYTDNALKRPSWDALKETMKDNPSAF